MTEKTNTPAESAFEKSFTPKVEDVYENEYTNKEGVKKKQCFIKINDKTSLILPYGKEELLQKFANEKFPDTLNIGIVKEHTYHVKETNKENQAEYKDVSGTELRKLIDYYINIGLKDAKINPTSFDENKVNIWKNGYQITVNKDWIKDGQFGQYLSVKHNAQVSLTKAVRVKNAEGKYEPALDENGNPKYEKTQRNFAYVKAVFDGEIFKKEHKPIDEKIAEAKEKNVAQDKETKSKNDLERD